MDDTLTGLGDAIADRDIIVCVGTGGVGKTTTSAAIGLRESLAGKKTLVMTIDPARRLADALGIPEVGNEEHRIPLNGINFKSSSEGGSFWAMMLESKRTFDRMVEKYAPSPEVAEKIFQNPFYKHVSGALSGSQEYMAIEMLSELHEARRYDLIVLDTPPSASALDFLTAPERMMAFLNQSVLQWFLKPYLTLSRLSFNTFKMGSRAFLKIVEKVVGGAVIRDLLDFFEGFEGMYEGFKQRAETVDRILRRSRTGFVLVAAPSRMTLDEAKVFLGKLKEMGMPLAAVVINRATFLPEGIDSSFLDRGRPTYDAVVEEVGGIDSPESSIVTNMWENALGFRELISKEMEEIGKFRAGVEEDVSMVTAPRFDEDIHELEGLNRLAEFLYNPRAHVNI